MELSITLGLVVLAVLLATMVEALTETLLRLFPDTLLEKLKNIKFAEWLATIVGIMLCLLLSFGVMAMLVSYLNMMLEVTLPQPPAWADFAITGILISRGGNWVHDLFSKLLATKE